MSRSPLRCGLLLIPLVLAFGCFALSPTAQAVDPPPDGGYFQFNTAEGEDALFSDDTSGAWYNTAIGYHALHENTFGIANTAMGASALSQNTTGNSNTATGFDALVSNTTGNWNTANGATALSSNSTGSFNVASGYNALRNNITGSNNTAIGSNAMFHNHAGSNNIALGYGAGINLGNDDANVAIGNPGVRNDAGTIRIGQAGTHTNTYIAGISGVAVPGGVGVVIDTDGHLGTVVSSERFKDAIRPMDKASEAILALKPVTFRYKKELDPDGIRSSAWSPNRWKR